MGELVAMVIAACVLLEYGVAGVGRRGRLERLLQRAARQTDRVAIPDALSYSPMPYEDNVTGLINLPAVVLVLLCTLLLIRGASESAQGQHDHGAGQARRPDAVRRRGAHRVQGRPVRRLLGRGSAGISAAAGTIFFSFIGLDAVSTAGEEVRDPQSALPRAIMGALVIVVGVYVLVAFAGVGSQPLEEFSSDEQQSAGLSVILENITGSRVPGTILAAGAVISIFSVTLVTLYGQTRILFAMGRDRMLPDQFAEVNPRTLTPTFNTIVVGVVVSLIAGFVPSDYLWDTVSIGTLVAFTVVAISSASSCAAPSPTWSGPSGCPATR